MSTTALLSPISLPPAAFLQGSDTLLQLKESSVAMCQSWREHRTGESFSAIFTIWCMVRNVVHGDVWSSSKVVRWVLFCVIRWQICCFLLSWHQMAWLFLYSCNLVFLVILLSLFKDFHRWNSWKSDDWLEHYVIPYLLVYRRLCFHRILLCSFRVTSQHFEILKHIEGMWNSWKFFFQKLVVVVVISISCVESRLVWNS